jgi:hypothetical protein
LEEGSKQRYPLNGFLYFSLIRAIVRKAAINARRAPKEKAHLTPKAFQITPIKRLAGKVATPMQKW